MAGYGRQRIRRAIVRDYLYKAKILMWLIVDAYRIWKKEVMHCDLDARYCCDGNECCCGAMTHRDYWEHCSPYPETRGNDHDSY